VGRIPIAHGQCQAVVKRVINIRVPLEAGNFLTICIFISISRRTLPHGVKWCLCQDISRNNTE
jgi:hypothetical protein